MIPLAPSAWTEFRFAPPPAEQVDGGPEKAPPSLITWNGMPATDSPPIWKSAWRTEPKA